MYLYQNGIQLRKQNQKFGEIKRTTFKWPTKPNRKYETVLHRLKIGHKT